jgi:hypothetical protein
MLEQTGAMATILTQLSIASEERPARCIPAKTRLISQFPMTQGTMFHAGFTSMLTATITTTNRTSTGREYNENSCFVCSWGAPLIGNHGTRRFLGTRLFLVVLENRASNGNVPDLAENTCNHRSAGSHHAGCTVCALLDTSWSRRAAFREMGGLVESVVLRCGAMYLCQHRKISLVAPFVVGAFVRYVFLIHDNRVEMSCSPKSGGWRTLSHVLNLAGGAP